MNNRALRILGVITGLIFIGFGISVSAGMLPRVPGPEWVFGLVVIILGVGFFGYGVTGKSKILEMLRS